MDKTVVDAWNRLAPKREEFLRRARDYASLTIPSVFQDEGSNGQDQYQTPFQSTGARGVNNLSSKLMLTLFPPASPFFTIEPNRESLQRIREAGGGDDEVDKVRNEFAEFEREALKRFESSNMRPALFQALQQLIIGGNTLVDWFDPDTPRVVHLDSHAVDRDPMGVVRMIVIRERIGTLSLPDEVRASIRLTERDLASGDVDLWTWVRLDVDGGYKMSQHAGQHAELVPGSERSFEKSDLPFVPVAFRRQPHECYGRGYVELFFGSLISLEALSQAIAEGTVAAARVLWMIDPSNPAAIRPRDLANKRNGEYTVGDADTIKALKLDKNADFLVANNAITRLTQEVEFGFLVNRSVQRQAERVTAEEIRFMAQELEEALGGAYGELTVVLQRPLVFLSLKQIGAGALARLSDIKVVSGVDGLGRGQELQRLRGFISDVINLDPEAQAAIDPIGLANALRLLHGVGTKHKIIRTPEELQAAQSQQRLTDLASRAAPNLVNAVSQAAQSQQPQGGA